MRGHRLSTGSWPWTSRWCPRVTTTVLIHAHGSFVHLYDLTANLVTLAAAVRSGRQPPGLFEACQSLPPFVGMVDDGPGATRRPG